MTIRNDKNALRGRAQRARRCRPPREFGAAYLMLLLTVMVMGIGLVAVSEVWHTTSQREKEQELLFIGNQYRQALELYYAQSPGGNAQRYPASLEDMLKDPRVPGTKRYLRKIFADPISGDKNWGLIRGPGGGIMGVHSMSVEEPIKKTNFSRLDRGFEGMKQYKDWVFVPRPSLAPVVPPKK